MGLGDCWNKGSLDILCYFNVICILWFFLVVILLIKIKLQYNKLNWIDLLFLLLFELILHYYYYILLGQKGHNIISHIFIPLCCCDFLYLCHYYCVLYSNSNSLPKTVLPFYYYCFIVYTPTYIHIYTPTTH